MSCRRGALACVLVSLGCGTAKEPPPPSRATLPVGTVARVGSDPIAAGTVSRLFRERGLTADAAVRLAVDDAVWAQGARELLPSTTSRTVERAAVARSLLQELSSAASAQGAPSHAEISALVEERWLEVARPPAARTTHVVVINAKPERDTAAHDVAFKLAEALRDAKTSADVLRIGKSFPGEGFELKAETLPFVTPDGRTFQRQGEEIFPLAPFDVDFARAANALQAVGQLSPVTKSQFGYHVIMLDERDPGFTLPEAELTALVVPELVSRRAAAARGELVERLRRQSPIQVERAADDLTAKIQLRP